MKFFFTILISFGFFSCKQAPSGFEKSEMDRKNKIETLKNTITYNTSLDEQIPIYNKILEIDNSNLNAHQNLGVIYYELEDFRKAIVYETKVIDILKNSENQYGYPLSLLMRGKSKFELEDYRGCINDLKQAELLNSDYQDIYVYLGYAYLNLNQIENACKYFSISGEKGYSEAYKLISKNCN